MRQCLFSGLLIIFVVSLTEAQDAKKKDEKTPEVTEVAGKSFAEWANEIKDVDPSKREMAYRMILNFGPEKAYQVVPQILTDLQRHTFNTPVDLSVRVNGTLAISTIFKYMHINKKEIDKKEMTKAVTIFTTALNDPQVVMKVRTVQALPYLGPEARNDKTISTVVKMVRDPATWEARQAAIQTLAVLAGSDPKFNPGTTSGSSIMNALYVSADQKIEKSSLVRVAAVQAIAVLGSVAPLHADKNVMIGKLLPILEGKTADPSPTVRYAAVQAITALGSTGTANDKSAYINRLAAKPLLDKDEASVRYVSVQAIGALGSSLGANDKAERANAAAKLAPAAKDSEPSVQMIYHVAMMNIQDNFGLAHVNPLCGFLQHTKPTVRVAALQHIGMLGPKGKLAIPSVTNAIRDKEKDVGLMAMSTLVALRAYDTISELKSIKDDVKLHADLREGAEAAIDDLLYVKKAEEEYLKKKDKK